MPSHTDSFSYTSEPMYEKGASVQLICDWGLSPNGVAQGTQGVVVKHVNSQTHVSVVCFVTVEARDLIE